MGPIGPTMLPVLKVNVLNEYKYVGAYTTVGKSPSVGTVLFGIGNNAKVALHNGKSLGLLMAKATGGE